MSSNNSYINRNKPKLLLLFVNFIFSNDAIGYIVDGVMDKKAIQQIRSELLQKFEEYDTINLYLEDAGVERFTLSSVVTATLFPHEYFYKLNKVAVVTDRKWIHMLASINKVLLAANYRNFTTEERQEAIDWIEAG